MDWQAIALSVQLATLTSAILLAVGLPLAWWLTSSRGPGRALVEAATALPLVLPPTVLGFYLLLAMGPQGPLGRAWDLAAGRHLAFSFEGLLLASVLYSLPFAVQPFAAAFASVDPRLVEASWCLGRSRLDTLLRVVLPLASPGILAGVVLSFAHTLGEFGVVLMVGGNIPGVTRTVSVSIYDDIQAMDYDGAAATARLLVAASFVLLALVYGLRRGGLSWPMPS